MEPITVTILSKQPRILPPEFEYSLDTEELKLRRKERLIQIYTDPGGTRVLTLADITLR